MPPLYMSEIYFLIMSFVLLIFAAAIPVNNFGGKKAKITTIVIIISTFLVVWLMSQHLYAAAILNLGRLTLIAMFFYLFSRAIIRKKSTGASARTSVSFANIFGIFGAILLIGGSLCLFIYIQPRIADLSSGFGQLSRAVSMETKNEYNDLLIFRGACIAAMILGSIGVLAALFQSMKSRDKVIEMDVAKTINTEKPSDTKSSHKRLDELKSLKEAGHITSEEYEIKRKAIIDEI